MIMRTKDEQMRQSHSKNTGRPSSFFLTHSSLKLFSHTLRLVCLCLLMARGVLLYSLRVARSLDSRTVMNKVSCKRGTDWRLFSHWSYSRMKSWKQVYSRTRDLLQESFFSIVFRAAASELKNFFPSITNSLVYIYSFIADVYVRYPILSVSLSQEKLIYTDIIKKHDFLSMKSSTDGMQCVHFIHTWWICAMSIRTYRKSLQLNIITITQVSYSFLPSLLFLPCLAQNPTLIWVHLHFV